MIYLQKSGIFWRSMGWKMLENVINIWNITYFSVFTGNHWCVYIHMYICTYLQPTVLISHVGRYSGLLYSNNYIHLFSSFKKSWKNTRSLGLIRKVALIALFFTFARFYRNSHNGVQVGNFISLKFATWWVLKSIARVVRKCRIRGTYFFRSFIIWEISQGCFTISSQLPIPSWSNFTYLWYYKFLKYSNFKEVSLIRHFLTPYKKGKFL
jgi:hypothetical protein